MPTPPLVSIITVNFRQAAITCAMLDTLRAASYPRMEVLVADNGQVADESARFSRHYPGVKVVATAQNLGFAGGNNLALAEAQGDYILLLNNDTLVPPYFLQPMVQAMEDAPRVGIVSPKIYYHDAPGVLQFAGTARLDLATFRANDPAKGSRDTGQWDDIRDIDFAHGACMLIRRALIADIGPMREDYFLYYEEIDYCLRARAAGWQIRLVPDSHIVHLESSTTGKHSPLKTHYMFRNRWLLARRFAPRREYALFLLYFFGVALPANAARFTVRRQWDHLRALWEGVIWNFKV